MPIHPFAADVNYLGGNLDSGADQFSNYYRFQGSQNPYAPQGNQMLDQRGQLSNQRDLNDRQNLQDLYGRLQAQANGASTPQQQQMLGGMQQAAGMQGSAAMSAGGGARGRSAALGGITQGAGIQGAQNQQNFGMQKASDQMSAINQMQQVSAAQRAQDLQSQGLTFEDAQRQAEMELRARGMNIQRNLGYAGMEGEANRMNTQSYLDSLSRNAPWQGKQQANKDAWFGRSASAAGSVFAMGA